MSSIRCNTRRRREQRLSCSAPGVVHQSIYHSNLAECMIDTLYLPLMRCIHGPLLPVLRSLQFEGGSTLACTLHEYCPRRSILTTFVACVQLAGMRTPLQKLSTCRIKTCVVVSSIQAKDPLCRVLCTYRLWVLDHDGNPHTFCYSLTIWSQIVQERLIQHNYIYKPLCVALLVHSVLEVERGSLPVLFTYDCVL